MAEPSTHIEAQVGNVSGGSQVAIGNYIVQIGRVEGGVVNILNEAPPPPRLRPQPVLFRPKPFPNLLDRETERATLIQSLNSQQSVECSGEPGAGKTSLLRHLAHQSQLATLFSAGIIYFEVNQQSASDLLKSIFDAFYICDFPIKPNDTEMRHYLQSLNALVLLDDVEGSAKQVQSLMNVAPNCAFVAVTHERMLFGDAEEVTLKGLPIRDAVSLFQTELRRSLSAQEAKSAEAICESVSCLPLLVLRAAHEARDKNRSLLEVVPRDKLAVIDQGLAAAEVESSSDNEKKVLAALAVFSGTSVAGEHVAAVAGVTNVQPVLDQLEQRGLAQAYEQHYKLAADVKPQQLGDLKHWFARAVVHLIDWAEQNRNQQKLIAASGAAILLLLKQAVDAQLWDEVRRLGHATEAALTLSGKWDMWATVLNYIKTAAQAQGDVAEQAWVLHQLGTRALGLGDRAAAEASLKDALGIRERLNDVNGAAVTRHNLNILLGPLPPKPEADHSSSDGGAVTETTSAPWWLKAGVLSLAGLAALTVFVVWWVWNRKPPQPPVPPPKIGSFSVSPLAIPANGQAQLCYEVENADRVRIEPNVGERKPASKECVSVTAGETMTYTLTAFATDGANTSRQITLNVEPVQPQAEIVHFEVRRQDGPAGANDVQFRLCYQVRNAAHAEIDNQGGSVFLDREHCQPVSPQQTTTYTLTATGGDGRTVKRQAIADATKLPAPRPQIVSFKASPDQVVDDGASQLCFQLKDAANAQLDPGARMFLGSSEEQCVSVRPLKTTTYTLKAFNSEGIETRDNTTITVFYSPKILEFAVNPQRITRGDSVSLCFKVENASGVSIEPGIARNRAAPSGERICLQQQPRATTTYTLTAFSDAGLKSPTRQETVTVDEPKLKHARIIFFDASSQRIKRGDSVRLCYGVADARTTTISPLRREMPSVDKNCIDHTPRASTTYVLNTTGEDQQTEKRELSVTVDVPVDQPPTPPVRITRFEINPTMVHGTQLCYTLDNARSARIEPGIGELRNLTDDCPKLPSLKQQTYTITATGADGKTASRTVTYTPPQPPKDVPISITSFSGPRQPIKPRTEAKLCYSTLGDGTARISPQPGTVTPSLLRRCVSVSPEKTTTYTLTVTGPQRQTSSKSVTVRVEDQVIIR